MTVELSHEFKEGTLQSQIDSNMLQVYVIGEEIIDHRQLSWKILAIHKFKVDLELSIEKPLEI